MMKLKILGVIFFGLYIGIGYGQEMLTVRQAVEIALANNYDIRLAKNDLLIVQENVTYGNAGMLPNVTGDFSQNNNLQNSTQTQNTGVVRALDNARNNSMTYGVSVGWTIFDGLGMFSRYETLKELEKQGDIQLKKAVLTQVSDVISTYYTIVEQNNLLLALDSSITISKERLQTAENRYMIGKASKLEVLNVQVNLNTDQTARIKQEEIVKNLKITLNNLLARDLDIEFDVVADVDVDEKLIFAELLEKSKKHNPDLLAIGISKRLAELELKTIKANRYPTVRLRGGYNFSETESSLGFVAQSSSRGLNYGVTASINIFDGFNQRRSERIAKLRIDNADLLASQQQNFVETSLMQAFQSYQTHVALYKLERKNVQIAKQNLAITMDKFRIGTISSVEFRDAQENYLNAVTRYNSSKLQAKLSETYLKEIVGAIRFGA
ncbi:TolC family protein [Sphingobacterium sp. SGG-5]|uniref:TolC family protein n=1 Tax=Sphingobacterium sp. SGG-5 TaxID=2710881 RepID=UPI0019CF8D07|nr:TolC family protein [Sphingobacterium sp. SGG-5]